MENATMLMTTLKLSNAWSVSASRSLGHLGAKCWPRNIDMASKCFKATLKQASLGFTGRLPIQRSTCPQATPLATDLRSPLNTKPYSLFGRLSCAEFDTWNVTSMSSRAHAWPAQVYFVFPTCACPLIIVLLHGAICVLHV